MTHNVLWTTLTTITLASIACGGPNFQFDPAPAPGWTAELNTDVKASSIQALGQAPATIQPQRDVELALRDAKARIAQVFESQVKSRSSDWSMALAGGERESERAVTQQNVEVRSNVTVEDVEVTETYRDEATKTQYVKVTVDRRAWTAKLQGRLKEGLAQMKAKLDGAETSIGSRKPLTAYGELVAAYELGRKIEPDIVVIDLLSSELGMRAELTQMHNHLGNLNKVLRNDFQFSINVKCTDGTVASQLASNIEAFLNGHGFRVIKKGGKPILVKVTVEQRFVDKEQVADRTEYVHAGGGELRVFEPDGTEMASLAVILSADRYQERDADKKKAKKKALSLAGDTIAAKLKSAFRTAYPGGE